MKVYIHKPKEKEVIIVKTGHYQYEFWMLTAERIGGATKTGSQRILSEDRQLFPNLTSAARYYLTLRQELDLANSMPTRVKQRFNYSGWELAEKGVWKQFADSRGIPARDSNALEHKYIISLSEAVALGLVRSEHE